MDIEVRVAQVYQPKEVTAGGCKRKILELMVRDETGAIRLVLWDEKSSFSFSVGDRLKVLNGFVTSFKGEWRINVGKYGKITVLE